MKVFNLACEHGHGFEGWFASEEDFLGQRSGGLLHCPVCDSGSVSKQLSAPRLNLGKSDAEGPVTSDLETRHQAEFLKAMRAIVQSAEDVGERFTEEARRMHHGESPERPIRGQTSLELARELRQEGIGVIPLPDLPALKNTLQ
jgi:hypothetical protein